MSQTKQKRSSAINNKYKYYLFYSKKTGELYAYSNRKDLSEVFYKTRDTSIFIYKEEMLTSSDLKDIHDEVPDALIELYTFSLGKSSISIPITLREKLELEHTVAQAMYVSLYTSAVIPPEIFTDKIKKYLDVIQYSSVYSECHSGKFDITKFQPDYLTCFLNLYGDMINLKGCEKS